MAQRLSQEMAYAAEWVKGNAAASSWSSTGYIPLWDRLVGLVVKASALRAADPGFEFRFLCRDFSRSSHISGLNIGTPVATLPGAWH